MPAIDVADLLSDPDFATTFDLIRTSEAPGNNGRGIFTPSTTTGIVGVVWPANTQDLMRLPDLERQGGSIMLATSYALTAGDPGTTADIIRWPSGTGRQYTVDLVDDFTQFGTGFVQAICRVLDLR